MIDPVIASTACSVISEPIKLIINTWLKPKLDEISNKRKIDIALLSDISDLFSEYLNRTYNEQKNVNVLALGLQQVEIEQIYLPLRIMSQEKSENITVTGFDLSFARKYRKIVIEDTAGMGKSTLMKKLFISSIHQNKIIPIFIELRNLVANKDIIDEIIENMSSINDICIDKDIIKELINRGDFVFFLDGYDEIAFQHKEVVTSKLLRFISKANRNIFFLTSRYDESLLSFGQFQKFNIDNLTHQEAYNILKRYDSVSGVKIAFKAIKQIKENLENRAFSELEEFLGNPLLVSLLYLTFRFKRDIPSSKIDFYRKVYDALYESHDLTKNGYKREKYSKLSCSEFQRVLTKLGFLCLIENINTYSKDKLIQLIINATDSPYFKEGIEDRIFRDLIETVPLITCVGFDYKWSHKSFMEYFAALYIENQKNKEEILTNIYNSSRFSLYLNALDFLSEINRQLFDKIFVFPVLNRFIKYIENNKGSRNIDFYQKMYNKAYILTSNKEILKKVFGPPSAISFSLKESISKNHPNINDYSMIGGCGNIDYWFAVMVKNINIESLSRLLQLRNYTFVKPYQLKWNENIIEYYTNNKEFDTYWASFEMPFSKHEEMAEAKHLIDNLSLKNLLYIDYSEAKKYMEIINEEMIKRKEEETLYSML